MTATRTADSASNTPTTLTKDTSDDADLSNKTISSPHELTDWVDGLLDTLQNRFDVMQGQVEERSEFSERVEERGARGTDWHGFCVPCSLSVSEMARRIDTLESSIEELLQGQSGAVQIAPDS
jgi:hypothetical protein